MTSHLLKDGQPIDIRVVDLNGLEKIADEANLQIKKEGTYYLFEGFTYFGPDTSPRIRKEFRPNRYEREHKLSVMEDQNGTRFKNESYHRAIVALAEGKPIGVAIFSWINQHLPFWRYFMNIAEVHEGYRRKGVATALMRELDGANFIKGRILQPSHFTSKGEKFLLPAMEKELNAKRYAWITPDYSPCFPAPQTPGIYNLYGRRIEHSKCRENAPQTG